MKLIIAICLIAAVAAAPPRVNYSNDNVQVVKFFYDNDNESGYRYEFEQTDGQKREEAGQLRNAGSENEYLVSRGSYSWVGPDGVTYTVTYVADENGFQPEIEQGPGGAVPAAVAASILG